MPRLALLIGSFLVTFALLISVWMLGTGRSPLGGLAATPTPAPTAAPTASPTQRPSPTASPSPAASPSPTVSPSPTASPSPLPTPPPATPSPSPAPLRTISPSFVPLPSSQPGGSQTFTLTGAEYATYQVPDHGSLMLNGDALVLRTAADASDVLWVTYRLDPALLPVGVVIHSVDAAICGQGRGDFWEVYGPTGSQPAEYEVVPPEADGCWHFSDAPTTDMSVIAATMLESQLVVERVVFTVTFGQ